MKKQYIINESGKVISVILPIKDYKKLLSLSEEQEDIKVYDAAMARLNEGKDFLVSFEDVLKK